LRTEKVIVISYGGTLFLSQHGVLFNPRSETVPEVRHLIVKGVIVWLSSYRNCNYWEKGLVL